MSKQASIHDIYDALIAGKQLIIEFPSTQAAETFRSSIYRYKKKQDVTMEGVGIDFDRMHLAFSIAPKGGANGTAMQGGSYPGAVQVVMLLKEKKQSTLYNIISVSDVVKPSSLGSGDEEVPANLE